MSLGTADCREAGVRVVRHDEISQGGAADLATRLVAELSHSPTGLGTLAARTVKLAPGVSPEAHHHESVESVICVISGEATIRWGAKLAFCCAIGPGDLILIPAGVTHQAENTSCTEALEYLRLAI
ncbi:MAG: cupin domain-containing protein [Gammaproteobacteria bacterium]